MKAAKTLLIISLICGALYLVGAIIYFAFVSASTTATLNSMNMGGYNAFAQYGIAYVIRLMIPSLIASGVGAVLNAINLAKKDIPWLALAAGIAYVVALFLAYGIYWAGNVIPAILSIVAFVLLLKSKPNKEESNNE